MRLTTPRVAPVPPDGWTEEQREIAEPMLARGPMLNIFRTLLAHPAAAKAFLVWGGYILGRKSTLPPRERERNRGDDRGGRRQRRSLSGRRLA